MPIIVRLTDIAKISDASRKIIIYLFIIQPYIYAYNLTKIHNTTQSILPSIGVVVAVGVSDA